MSDIHGCTVGKLKGETDPEITEAFWIFVTKLVGKILDEQISSSEVERFLKLELSARQLLDGWKIFLLAHENKNGLILFVKSSLAENEQKK